MSSERVVRFSVMQPLRAPFAAEKRDEDELRKLRAMSIEDKLALFLELCDLSDSIVNARPDWEKLRAPTRRSAESEALWKRLMKTRHG